MNTAYFFYCFTCNTTCWVNSWKKLTLSKSCLPTVLLQLLFCLGLVQSNTKWNSWPSLKVLLEFLDGFYNSPPTRMPKKTVSEKTFPSYVSIIFNIYNLTKQNKKYKFPWPQNFKNSVQMKHTLKTAACGDPNSMNGGFPVAISTIVQPSDQISAWNEGRSLINGKQNTHTYGGVSKSFQMESIKK